MPALHEAGSLRCFLRNSSAGNCTYQGNIREHICGDAGRRVDRKRIPPSGTQFDADTVQNEQELIVSSQSRAWRISSGRRRCFGSDAATSSAKLPITASLRPLGYGCLVLKRYDEQCAFAFDVNTPVVSGQLALNLDDVTAKLG